MADQVKFKKGLSTNLDNVAIENGSILLTTDDNKLYVDSSDTRIAVGGGNEMYAKYVGGAKSISIGGSSTSCTLTTSDFDYIKLTSWVANSWNPNSNVSAFESHLLSMPVLIMKNTTTIAPVIRYCYPTNYSAYNKVTAVMVTCVSSGTSLTISTGHSDNDYYFRISIELYKYV